MSNDQQKVKNLQAELALIEKAIPAEAAAKDICEFIDQNKQDDFLAGTAEGLNAWTQSPDSGGNCCIIM